MPHQKRLNRGLEMSDLINKVGGISNARKIVIYAPKHAEYYSLLGLSNHYRKSIRNNLHQPDIDNGYTKAYDFWDGRKWNSCACMPEHLDDLILIDDLIKAIDDHDRTDFCNNFENGLSPSTTVINK